MPGLQITRVIYALYRRSWIPADCNGWAGWLEVLVVQSFCTSSQTGSNVYQCFLKMPGTCGSVVLVCFGTEGAEQWLLEYNFARIQGQRDCWRFSLPKCIALLLAWRDTESFDRSTFWKALHYRLYYFSPFFSLFFFFLKGIYVLPS